MNANTIAVRNAKGQWVCAKHPDAYDTKCGLCEYADMFELARVKHEGRISELAFSYLKDGMTPEEATTKARENYNKMYEIHNRIGHDQPLGG